jgi:hypothetical protein
MNALSGSESSAAGARLPALLEEIELRGYSADTVEAATEAVALAREVGDPALLARALYCGLRANLAAGKWGSAVKLGEEAAVVCISNGDHLGEYKARYLVGMRYGVTVKLLRRLSPTNTPVGSRVRSAILSAKSAVLI